MFAEHTDGACGEDRDALRRAVREASGKTHPHVARLAGPLLCGPPAARLSWGLRALISGIERTAVPG
ncbi:hypothetical protein JHN52_39435 [Streptomyces sp. MBT97]|uniref:hypothetical protein n=1 Tax=Streptomyces sp. MBT97 TaxID=2800411 RepID=UPI00190C0841|nr:hypothetical protein [Streptomyces sp. MBT97]MBK3638809.1 hypothetical protein [Streptomyces sp. MBT97]